MLEDDVVPWIELLFSPRRLVRILKCQCVVEVKELYVSTQSVWCGHRVEPPVTDPTKWRCKTDHAFGFVMTFDQVAPLDAGQFKDYTYENFIVRAFPNDLPR